MKGWLRVKEAMEYCGVSERTIYNWIKHEGLKQSKVRGTVLISVKELDSFLETHTVTDMTELEINIIIEDVMK